MKVTFYLEDEGSRFLQNPQPSLTAPHCGTQPSPTQNFTKTSTPCLQFQILTPNINSKMHSPTNYFNSNSYWIKWRFFK